ncbi:MAG: phosphomannose isomerase type II C-terminal cupin domain [Alphaproteobacteria bacterium]|nr:phosphomannose isomerase type II C-terminal cupin domain [Alphaproteobacteria bacterium]
MEIGERPWGRYEVILEASGYKVKRITVEPGGRLSLQSHKHRSEHWVVVSGIAKITINDTIQRLEAGKSAYIPLGSKHRLENEGKEPMALIEVQLGDYLGEDDIKRYEDIYGR